MSEAIYVCKNAKEQYWCDATQIYKASEFVGEYAPTATPTALIEAERRGMMLAAGIMQQWADEAHASIDTGHPSGMNVAREQERDLCKEAVEAIRAAATELGKP